MSRDEPAVEELGRAIFNELASVVRGDLDDVVLVHDAAVGLDDRAAEHPHLPKLE